jgi:hypothetical protein
MALRHTPFLEGIDCCRRLTGTGHQFRVTEPGIEGAGIDLKTMEIKVVW